MDKVYLAIGEMVEVKEEHTLNPSEKETIIVRKGDKGYLDSEGYIVYVTGDATGIRVRSDDIGVEGYHIANISLKILDDLNYEFDLYDLLDEKGVEIEHVFHCIRNSVGDIFIN